MPVVCVLGTPIWPRAVAAHVQRWLATGRLDVVALWPTPSMGLLDQALDPSDRK
jgi:hypothetical protein